MPAYPEKFCIMPIFAKKQIMDAILVRPKSKSDLKLLSELLKKMKIPAHLLSADEKEDIAILSLMNEADRKKKVSREHVMAKLTR
jgi:hypothetical protein